MILAFLQAPVVLTRAHAHNDYLHTRPLQDALDQGFNSVEADVFLVDGKLLVAHDRKDLKPERSLDALYLAPLSKRILANGGTVYAGAKDVFWVLIDIKEKGDDVYKQLKTELQKHPELAWNSKKPTIRFVISGDRPIEAMIPDQGKYAGLDGRLTEVDRGFSPEFMPWISESWTTHFKWRGVGDFPQPEKEKLASLCKKIHNQKRLVRFWGGPDAKSFWAAQWDGGVDLLNADRLQMLKEWILERNPRH